MVNTKKSSGSKDSSKTSSSSSSRSSSSASTENTPSAGADSPVSDVASLGGVVQTGDDDHMEVWIFLALWAFWGMRTNIFAFLKRREQDV
ncbi:MAG TPA: hypothetical protein DD414_07640 [Lachnospiraceae bacterium]|nr:hypothetical protein [Lachnospiraceae bacterium]